MRSVGFVVVGAILGSIAGLGSAAAERIWTDDIPTGRDFVKPPIPARPLSDAEREARGRMLALPLPAPLEISPLRAAVLDAITDLKAGSSDPDMQAAVDQLGTLYGSDLAGPFWTHESGYLPRARAVISEIRKVGDFGIDPDRIRIPELNAASLADIAAGEVRMTLAVLDYAAEAFGARYKPNDISLWLDNKPETPDAADLLPRLAAASDPAAELRRLHPAHPEFEKLRVAYLVATGRRAADPVPEPVKIPDGPRFKIGADHAHVALVRERLGLPSSDGRETYLDRELAGEISLFLRRNGRRARYEINDDLRAVLNAPARAARLPDVRKIEANMLRWRWLPRDLGKVHVWNNLPEFETRLVDNGNVIMRERIIIGQTSQQTPVFSDTMEHIVFKPQWGVPNSIKIADLLPRLRGGDYGVLARRGMRIVKNGRTIDPSQIRWSSTDIRYLSIVTGPGGGNPLGELKFMFPNKHSVYMHDTTSKGLFGSRERTFSHGCIRVRNPRKFAETIFSKVQNWDPKLVSDLLHYRAEENRQVDLPVKIHVHNVYFTLVSNGRGGFTEFKDIYGHDRRIADALSGRSLRAIAANDPARLHQERIESIERSSRWNSASFDTFDSVQPRKRRSRRGYSERYAYEPSFLGAAAPPRQERRRYQRELRPAWPPMFFQGN